MCSLFILYLHSLKMQIQNEKVIRHINDGKKFSSDDFDKSDEE